MQTFGHPIVEQQFLGYNDRLPPQFLPPGQFVNLLNVRISDGRIEKVMGTSAIAAQIADQQFVGLAELEIAASSTKFIVAALNGVSNASWYSWDGSGTFDLIIDSTHFTNDALFFYETAVDKLYGFNGKEVGTWDGTDFALNPSSVPIGYYPAWFHNYLFVAKTDANPNRLYFSNLGNPDTFTDGDFVDVNPGDGDEIMGLGVLNDELFVFKRNTIWSITGFSGTTFSSTTKGTQNTNNRIYGYGCIAPGSIVSTGNDIYFLSFVGDVPHIRSLVKTQYATTIEGGIITDDISGTMDRLNRTALSTSQGIYDGRYVKWSLPTGGSALPDLVIELDTYGISKSRGKTIYPFVKRGGIHPQFFIISTISGAATVYFADWLATAPYTQGIVYKFDPTINTDLLLQNQIAMSVITRAYMPDPARKQKWKYLYLKHDTGEISSLVINANVDQGDFSQQALIDLNTGDGNRLDSFVLDTSTLGGAGGSVASNRINLAGMVGKMAQFNYSESSNAPLSIYDWEIYTIPKGLRAS